MAQWRNALSISDIARRSLLTRHRLKHWIDLLEKLHLIGNMTSIGVFEAKLIFLWSKVCFGFRV
jgi:hypothetical protein